MFLRFVSDSAKYTYQAIPVTEEILADSHGHSRLTVTDKGVNCEFRHGLLMQWEWETAASTFGFRGLAEHEDPRWRFSAYDTDIESLQNKWTKERKQEVEQRLLASVGTGHIHVEKPRLEAPWRGYPKIKGKNAAEEIARIVRETEFDPHYVMNYERENLNRQAVIDAVNAVELELVQEEVVA